MRRARLSRNAFAWLALCVACLAFVFKVKLHSDLLFFDDLTVDIFSFSGSILDWKFPPAPAFFPDILLYWVAYFLFDGVVSRVVFVCAAQAFLVAWASIYLATVVRPLLTDFAKSLIVLLVAAVILVSLRSNMWLFFNSTNNHFASLLCALAGFAWLLQFVRSGRYSYLIGVALACFSGALSTPVFILTFSSPIVVLALSWMGVRGVCGTKQALPVILAVFVGHAAAAGVGSAVVRYSAFAERVPLSLASMANAIQMLRAAFVLVFSRDNLYTLGLSVFFVAVFVFLAVRVYGWTRIRVLRSNRNGVILRFSYPVEQQFFVFLLLYCIVASLIVVTGSLLSGAFADPYGFRYFSLPVGVGVLLWVLGLDFNGVLEKRVFRVFVALTVALCATAGAKDAFVLFDEYGKSGVEKVLVSGAPYLEAESACLKKIEEDGFVFGSGIGDFWNARGLRYRMGSKSYILPVTKDGRVFFHMMGLGPLETPARYGVERYNFAVLNKSETHSQFDLTPETLGMSLPRPDAVESCKGSDREIWIYSSDSLDHFVQQKIGQFLFALGRPRAAYMSDVSQLPGNVGRPEERVRVAEQGRDSEGFLSYGPYIDLPKGRYTVQVDYASTAGGSRWDFGIFGNPGSPPVSLGGGEIGVSSKGQIEYTFETDRDLQRVEVRTWFGGTGRLMIRSVQIRREP